MKPLITNLWMGKDLPEFSASAYGVRDIEALYHGMKRHVTDGRMFVMVDERAHNLLTIHLPTAIYDDITIIPYEGTFDRHGGWSRMLECFSPKTWETMGSPNRAVMFQLDLVLTGNCDWLWSWDQAPIGLPMDPYQRHKITDPVVTFNHAGQTVIWREAMNCVGLDVFPHRLWDLACEMVLLQELVTRHNLPTLEGYTMEKLMSYKACRLADRATIPDGTSIVYFHGTPKPSQIPDSSPIKQAWLSTQPQS